MGLVYVAINMVGRENHSGTGLCFNPESQKLLPYRKGQVKRKKEMSWRIVNIQHVTLNGMTQQQSSGCPLAQKVVLPKRHSLTDCNRLPI